MSFVEEVKDNEDKKGLFYKEVVKVAAHIQDDEKPSDQSLASAVQLSKYISDLEAQHRKKSGIRRVFASAQPLVEGLMQFTSAVDVMIQADPTFSALLYGGAKLVLQVCAPSCKIRVLEFSNSSQLANGYNRYFEQITQMMADIGLQLQCFHIYTREIRY